MTAVLASGCAVYPAHDAYYRNEPVVTVAPPPLQYEQPGYPPSSEFVWIAGYWNWAGARYVWVPGRWEAPRPGLYWVPHRWERDANQWRRQGGRWERDTRPRPAAAPLPVRQAGHPHSHHPPPAPALRPEPDRSQGQQPHVIPLSGRDSHQPSPAPAIRSEPARTHGAAATVAPKFERDSRRPSELDDGRRFKRHETPDEGRPAPEPHDRSRARSDVTPKPELKDRPWPSLHAVH